MKINTKVEFKQITKTFGTLVANDNLSFKVNQGDIHALIGENGAGKSTLMSILFGIYEPTKGSILIDGKEVVIKGPSHATALGLGMVHQHFKLVGIYNAVQNIVLGKESKKHGFLDFKTPKEKLEVLAKKYNFDIDLNLSVNKMTVGMQQKVEILKMLYTDADILIFDEPTAVLAPEEIKGFLKLLLEFKKAGKTIIIITHKLEEIKAVADKATIIRKGKLIKTDLLISKTSTSKMAELMVGTKLTKSMKKYSKISDNIILEVKNVTVKKHGTNKNALNNFTFDIKEAEIVAIAGVEGNGQTELSELVAGMIHANSGNLLFKGKDITKGSPRKNNIAGISHIPEDRHKHGLVLDSSIGDNMTLNSFWKRPYSNFGIINQRARDRFASHVLANFDVRGAKNGTAIARGLSGGNQQKAIVGREMMKEHDLLIAVQPTRGLDLGAVGYINKQILNEKEKGKSVLLISYELEEIIDVADRVIVVNDGYITGELVGSKISMSSIGKLMAKDASKQEAK